MRRGISFDLDALEWAAEESRGFCRRLEGIGTSVDLEASGLELTRKVVLNVPARDIRVLLEKL
jgi:hypothetical protein